MSKRPNEPADNRQITRDDALFMNSIAPPYTNNNFTCPDAQALAELLLEKSQKCSFFKPQGLRRARYVRRNLSVDCIPKETIAPTSTPDLTFLSGEDSAKSSISMEGEGMEITRNGSNLSLAQTWSTVGEGVETAYGAPPTKTTLLLEKHTKDPKVNAKSKSPAVPRNYSFSLGPHVHQAKKWTRNILNDIRGPLRRSRTPEGKRPAVDLPQGLLSMPPPKSFSRHLSDPSSSGQFPWLKEEGGNGPPKGLSALTLDRLDVIEKEQARLIGKFEELERVKRKILLKANGERRSRKG